MVKRELASIECLPCVTSTLHTSHLIFTITREIGIIVLILSIKMILKEIKQCTEVTWLTSGGTKVWIRMWLSPKALCLWYKQYYNIINNSYYSLTVNFEGRGGMDLVLKHYYHNVRNNTNSLYIYAYCTNKESGIQSLRLIKDHMANECKSQYQTQDTQNHALNHDACWYCLLFVPYDCRAS